VAGWMYTRSLGIQRDMDYPGFKHFNLQPIPDETGKVTFAKGYVETMYGKIKSAWQKNGKLIRYQFTIPANTSAHVILMGKKISDSKKDGHLSKSFLIKANGLEATLESGTYEFNVEN
jgi:alpha-L-rhamnosidase